MKEDARILLVDDQGFNITALKIILKVQFKIDSD
jgi:PleD family two-component response regulator